MPKTIEVGFINVGTGPRSGVPVHFQIVSGPNAGAEGTVDPADGLTDADGRIRFTYNGTNGPGTDVIIATATIDGGFVVTPETKVRRFRPATSADYDGDGISDFALYSFDQAVGQGKFSFRLSRDGGTPSLNFGGLADRPIVGDFDGDSIMDIGVYGFSPNDGYSRYAIRRSSDGAVSVGGFGGPSDRPVIGDFDGDGRDDLAVYGLSPDGVNRFAVLPSSNPAAAYLVPFGGPGDLPLAGDFDGDGLDDLAVYGYSPLDGYSRFAIRPTGNPEAGFAVPFGGAGDGPVVGDFDGDLIDDIAVYGFSPSNGFSRFAIRPSSNPDASYPVAFGGGDDAPIAADFDGDGLTDIAVYGFSPLDNASRFAVLRSSDGQGVSTPMGSFGSMALPIAPGRFRPPTIGVGTDTARLQASAFAEALVEASGSVKTARSAGREAWARQVDEAMPEFDLDGLRFRRSGKG